MKIIKSIFLTAFILLSVDCLWSLELPKDHLYRSSLTLTNDTGVCLASGNVIAYIEIQTAGTNSSIDVYEGTSTVTGTLRDRLNTTSTRVCPIDKYRDGYTYTTTGDTPAAIKIHWDWEDNIPKGQEDKGK